MADDTRKAMLKKKVMAAAEEKVVKEIEHKKRSIDERKRKLDEEKKKLDDELVEFSTAKRRKMNEEVEKKWPEEEGG